MISFEEVFKERKNKNTTLSILKLVLELSSILVIIDKRRVVVSYVYSLILER